MSKFILVLVVLSSCAVQAQKTKPVYEDLSGLRPKFSPPVDSAMASNNLPVTEKQPVVEPTHTVNQKVDLVLDSVDRINTLNKFIPGFTIQVYSGLNREEAGNARIKLADELSMKADLQYMQPKFRVRVGYYFTSLEAQKDLAEVRRFYPNAILVPERIPIR